MNSKLSELLASLDASNDRMDEISISSQINAVSEGDKNSQSLAEKMAFAFYESSGEEATTWGTYYGPMTVLKEADGQFYENPSLKLVSKEMLDYWLDRARSTSNAIMKARYAGLVWDLSEKAVGIKPDYKAAAIHAESLIEVCKMDLYDHDTDGVTKISRAYSVAKSTNNESLWLNVIKEAIALEDRIAQDQYAGLWGFCFDLFVLGKDKKITKAQKEKLLNDMESRLIRVSGENQDPWLSEAAGVPLATYYRSLEDNEAISRVVMMIGSNFEGTAEGAAPLLASTHYQHAYELYVSFNLKEAAEAVSKKVADIGPSVAGDMKKFSHTMEIPKEKLDAIASELIQGDIASDLNRIAFYFVPHKERIENQVVDLAKKFPLSGLFTPTIQDRKGRPIAQLGSVQTDLEGHAVQQLSQNIALEGIFLNFCFDKFIEVHKPTADQIVEHIVTAPVFEADKKELLARGIKAYIEADYISASHILIPQIEAAIRSLLELSGGILYKRNRLGGFQHRTLDELLRDQVILDCLGKDVIFYFRVLFTDQRGLNMRNDISHGLLPSTAFHRSQADSILHSLLMLATIRSKS